MKKIENLKVHQIEQEFLLSITGGKLVQAGSNGSWSWSAGSYTNDCIDYGLDIQCTVCKADYTGSISYDGRMLYNHGNFAG